jgi:hypothetical protein
MSRLVYLHVGAPKTGTTYLQDRLKLNSATLADHGVHVPSGSRFIDADLFHFRAALDLLEQDWGGPQGHAAGSWDALMRKVRRTQGTVVISHEILAPAKPSKVAKAMNDLQGSEVHIVYSARDLGRQLPAAWQESIKQGRKWSFNRFLTKVESGKPWFSRALDLPRVLSTWGAHLPPERVHVVTVPPPGVDGKRGDLLWLRFCGAFGIDPAWAPLDSERANRSLGVAETALIRRLNRRMDRSVRREATYDKLVREVLAQQGLADRDTAPVRLSPERYEWAEEQAELWVDWLEGSDVDIVGDVADLRPVRPDPGTLWLDPDKVRAKPVLKAAIAGLEAMTREAAGRPDPDRRLGSLVRHGADRLRRR